MPNSSNKLTQFWNELKRRKVVHVITVYASAAFVLIELVNNLTEPLNLPPNLATIVIIILAVGFPLAIVLSWLYDLTGEGIEKTKPIDELSEEQSRTVPNAWRIATIISFIVIIGLVTIHIAGGKGLRPGDIQSVLILPYNNYTGDEQLDAIISGMHSALINDVGRITTVISKTTSEAYKNAGKTLSQIAAELGVDAIIEPGVSCAGDTICFQLAMNTPDEEQLWMAEYSEPKSQIPNIHNQITKQIADELKIELTDKQVNILSGSRTVDPGAVDAYLKGLHYLDLINKNSLEKAKEYFNLAIETEPDWAPPYAGLTEAFAYQLQMSFISPSIAIPNIYDNLNKALELDPNSANSHYIKAMIAVWTEWNWEKGEEEFIKSLELNPSNAQGRVFYAHLLNILQRPDEATHQAKLALKLDPLRPLILTLVGSAKHYTGDLESGIALYEKALSIDPTHRLAIYSISGAYRQMGDYEKWFEYFKKIGWQDEKTVAAVDSVFQEQGYRAAVEMTIKIDEEAANDGYIDHDILGFRYLELNNYDKAMDCFEKAYDIHHPMIPYFGELVNNYEQLRENPRAIALLKKMNLPLP